MGVIFPMRKCIPLSLLISAGVLITTPAALNAQTQASNVRATPAAAYTHAEAREMINRLGELLARNYVYANIGAKYAAMLRRNADTGEYDNLAPDALAKKLTSDLQAVSKDGHLRLFAPGAVTPQMVVGGGVSDAIGAARWIADGVAYLRLNILPGNPNAVAALEKLLQEHADAKTLIIDNRATPGGNGGTGDLMMSYLFDTPTALLQMEMRNEPYAAGFAPVREGPGVRRIAAPEGYVRWERSISPHPAERRLQDAQVFYLTSKRTGSAAEAMALALKRTKRAVLIGENTYGAGYFTRPMDLGLGFSVNLPIGRTFDPDTGLGFEGTGVAPDVAVPAAQALEEALKRAGVTEPAKLAEAVARAA